MRFLLLTIFTSCISLLHAETRVWKSSDGNQSFSGTYVSHDSKRVTIRRADGQVFTFDVSRLNAADKTWLASKPVAGKKEAEPLPDPNAVFDTLCFGDSRADVIKKLKASKVVEGGLDETFMGRTGMNGIYRTRQKIGGLQCDLYFDWSPGNNLKEVSLQTQTVETTSYDSLLKENWEQLEQLLTMLHGNPVQNASFPNLDDLQNDLFLASHLWRLEGGGSALLGTSMQGGKVMVVVRFTTERIDPVRTP